MGATCTAAQTRMHPQRIPSQEYDQNGAESGIGRRRRAPVGMAPVCFAATDCFDCRRRIGKVSAAHLRSKVTAREVRKNRRDFLAI